MSGRENENLKSLGSKVTNYSMDYDPSVLETFENRHPDNDYFVKFNCPEFTSLCPITGQPDFATISISYVPDKRMVESKSLKLYLFSYRNHGDFHEGPFHRPLLQLRAAGDPLGRSRLGPPVPPRYVSGKGSGPDLNSPPVLRCTGADAGEMSRNENRNLKS